MPSSKILQSANLLQLDSANMQTTNDVVEPHPAAVFAYIVGWQEVFSNGVLHV